jgi:ATP-dependent Clp protease ATP-binding subunit ClpX
LREVQPEDLLKYGMIPEFVGRMPVIAPLHELDEASLIDILTKPKNALTRQYQRLFEMDGVGARGLRAILEQTMLDMMFDIPTAAPPVKEIVISEETIQTGAQPLLLYQKGAAAAAGGDKAS